MEAIHSISRHFQNNELITVTLLDCNENFWIQKAFLCNTSPYFAKVIQRSSREGRECVLQLMDCTTSVFELFLFWLCNRHLPVSIAAHENFYAELETVDEIREIEEQQTRLVDLWIFAERCYIPALQNEAMRCLLLYLRLFRPCVEPVRLAMEQCSDCSPLRRLIIREATADLVTKQYDWKERRQLEAIPGFMHDFADELWKHYDHELQKLNVESVAQNDDSHGEYTVPES